MIVFGESSCRELEGQRGLGVGDDTAGEIGSSFLRKRPVAKPTRDRSGRDHQQPHRGKVPQQRAAEPAARGESSRSLKPNSGEHCRSDPDMIIRTIATALIQCNRRTQAAE